MAASSRAQVLDLYRAMLRESKHFSAYNYRTYAVRRIRDAFRENKNVKDPVEIQALVNKAKRDLGIIRRQVRWFDDVLSFIKSCKLWHIPLNWPSLLLVFMIYTMGSWNCSSYSYRHRKMTYHITELKENIKENISFPESQECILPGGCILIVH